MLCKIQTVLIAFLSFSTCPVINASSLRRGAAGLPLHRHQLLGDGDQQDGNKVDERNLQNATPDSTTTEPTVTLTETLVPTAPNTEESWEDLTLWQKIVGVVCVVFMFVVGYWCCCVTNYFDKRLLPCIVATFCVLLAAAGDTDKQREEEQKRQEEQNRCAAWEQQQQQLQQQREASCY